MGKVLKSLVLTVCITSLSGCLKLVETAYEQPKEGTPRAKIILNTAGANFKPEIVSYANGSDCTGRRKVDVSHDGNREFYVDAQAEVTLGLAVHALTGGFNVTVSHDCEVPFSFFPKPDHVYSLRVKAADRQCGVRLTDISGEYIYVRSREPQTLLPIATGWCK